MRFNGLAITVGIMLVLSTALVLGAQAPAGASTGAIAVTVKPRAGEIVLREPVELILTLANGTPEPVAVDLGFDRKTNIVLSVTGPDGKTRVGQIGIHEGAAGSGRLTLDSGKTYVQQLIADEWTDFSQSGAYHIILSLKSPITFKDGSKVTPPSSEAVVHVHPENSEALKKFCAQKVQQLLAASTYSEAMDPAVSLSHVHDPVAIPYLRQAYATKYGLHSLFISALEQIGTDDATRNLLDILHSGSPVEPEVIKPALYRLEKKIGNEQLKLEIRAALQENN